MTSSSWAFPSLPASIFMLAMMDWSSFKCEPRVSGACSAIGKWPSFRQLQSVDAAFTIHRSGEWRNRQTRRLQMPVFARTWGFKPPLAHTVYYQHPFSYVIF